MKVPMLALRMVTVGAHLVLSLATIALALAVLPPLLMLTCGLAMAATLAAPPLGRLEVAAIGLLTWSRPARAAEHARMAPVRGELASRGVVIGRVLVRRTPHTSVVPALALGHETVVVTPGVIDAVGQRATTLEAAAQLAQAILRRPAIRPRLELAVLAATAPARILGALCRRAGRALTVPPLVSTTWRVRGMVGLVCLAQAAANDHLAAGFTAAAVIGLTYLVPAAQGAIDARADAEAERLVVALGLGRAPADLPCREVPPPPQTRLQHLASADQTPRRLHLVRD